MRPPPRPAERRADTTWRPDTETNRPERIAPTDRIHLANAARRAQRRYPGPAGAVLAKEIETYADMGWLAHPNAPIARLIAELMAPQIPDNVA